ncbi:uncharacterized protein B0T15DRAFT_507741 [Chaetomium strumarium]|uniref:Secreted protein n=1 Tax=Chaetomium strumarium TaxID=1170767 RepID=A0AAJ0M6Y4_9PEZI|nr:hypothetical protein B0T15DRAFT_507741 [Chaetomium strumarium]
MKKLFFSRAASMLLLSKVSVCNDAGSDGGMNKGSRRDAAASFYVLYLILTTVRANLQDPHETRGGVSEDLSGYPKRREDRTSRARTVTRLARLARGLRFEQKPAVTKPVHMNDRPFRVAAARRRLRTAIGRQRLPNRNHCWAEMGHRYPKACFEPVASRGLTVAPTPMLGSSSNPVSSGQWVNTSVRNPVSTDASLNSAHSPARRASFAQQLSWWSDVAPRQA